MLSIYKFTNLLNGKIYVGSTINMLRRISEHKRDAVRPKTKGFDKSLSDIDGFKMTYRYYRPDSLPEWVRKLDWENVKPIIKEAQNVPSR